MPIKTLKKPVNPRKKLKGLITKADKALQEAIRKTYQNCLVCGKSGTIGHHYIYKSQSNYLRYHWDNIVPLCYTCHFNLHHKGPETQNRINEIKGEAWYKELEALKRKGHKEGFRFTIKYLESKLEALKNIIK